jgi:hypothetical protein
MTAPVGDEVKRTLSMVPGLGGVTGEIRGDVATKSHQARGQEGTELTEVHWQLLMHGGLEHGWRSRWTASSAVTSTKSWPT